MARLSTALATERRVSLLDATSAKCTAWMMHEGTPPLMSRGEQPGRQTLVERRTCERSGLRALAAAVSVLVPGKGTQREHSKHITGDRKRMIDILSFPVQMIRNPFAVESTD